LKKNLSPHRNSGFTLIELVIVIVILGILAATALPKFVDISTDARKSTLKTVKSSLESSVKKLRVICNLYAI
jgi:MSHA pilin protein MshA